jgi:hypothetical protein
VLSEAAITAARDQLLGPKENVMLGRLIPAGTGLASGGREPPESVAPAGTAFIQGPHAPRSPETPR